MAAFVLPAAIDSRKPICGTKAREVKISILKFSCL